MKILRDIDGVEYRASGWQPGNGGVDKATMIRLTLEHQNSVVPVKRRGLEVQERLGWTKGLKLYNAGGERVPPEWVGFDDWPDRPAPGQAF